MAKLYFYYSSMNAGKTTTLLQSNHNYRERGMHTLLFTPSLDTRFGEHKIVSRIGLRADAISFSSTFDFWAHAKDIVQLSPHPMHCVLIDEVQFLTKLQVLQLCQIVDKLSIPVLTYGLRTNFKGEPFEGSQYLLAWADELIELKGICHCGKKATMSIRLNSLGQPTTEGDSIEIGGNEKYVSVCRKHFFSKMADPETPKTFKESSSKEQIVKSSSRKYQPAHHPT